MTEPATTEPPADPDRLDRIESKVDTLADVVAKLVPGSHAEAQDREEARLDRPSTVEEQVRAELARRDKQAADDQAAAAAQTERETLQARLAKLEEQPPQPPVRRATKLLGWGG